MSRKDLASNSSATFYSPPARAFQDLSGRSSTIGLVADNSPLDPSGRPLQLVTPEGPLLKQEELPSPRREPISSPTLYSLAPSIST